MRYSYESSRVNSKLIHINKTLHRYEELLKYVYSNMSSLFELLCPESYPASSCSHMHYFQPFSSDEYYWIRSREGNSVQAYCSSFSFSMNSIPGWMRIAELNKTGTFTQCISGMKPYSVNAGSCVAQSDVLIQYSPRTMFHASERVNSFEFIA